MKNRKKRPEILCVMIVAAVMFLGALLISVAASASSMTVLNFVNPTHGPAKIKGETATYHYFRTKITAKQRSDLSFKENDCLIFGREGKSYSKCWIYVAGWSAGLSVSQRAPIMMKTLSVEISGGESSSTHQWNTSIVDGPKGALEFNIPEGGFVEVYFLWEVPKGFSASRVKIGDNLEIAF